MADHINGIMKNLNRSLKDVLKFGHPVVAIRNDRSPVEVVTESGEVFTCEKVLMCVPAGTIGRINFAKLSEGKRLIF
jgi:monoamine oxidase